MTEAKLAENTVVTSFTDGISQITLNKPPVNILDISMMKELKLALESDEVLKQARVVVIQAMGKAFSAGVDVADHTAERMEEMLEVFHAVISIVKNITVPTVACVQGAALGGGAELACSCDLILASEKAKFGQPEILLGVYPPVAMVELPQAVGVRKAAELIFTGESVVAAEAQRIGLINEVYSVEEFSTKCQEFVGKFTRLSRSSLAETKTAFREVLTISDPANAINAAERRYLESLMITDDAKEGIQAFIEKRQPVWTHK